MNTINFIPNIVRYHVAGDLLVVNMNCNHATWPSNDIEFGPAKQKIRCGTKKNKYRRSLAVHVHTVTHIKMGKHIGRIVFSITRF
jgi:hypothetical protein